MKKSELPQIIFRVTPSAKIDFDVIIARLQRKQQDVLCELFTQFIDNNKQYL